MSGSENLGEGVSVYVSRTKGNGWLGSQEMRVAGNGAAGFWGISVPPMFSTLNLPLSFPNGSQSSSQTTSRQDSQALAGL